MVRFTCSSLIMGDVPTEDREGRALARPPAPPALHPGAAPGPPGGRRSGPRARERAEQAGWQGPDKTIKQRNIAHTSASHVAAKGGDFVPTLAIGQLPYRAFSLPCPDSGRSAALATSPTRSAMERKTGIQARSKKSRLSLSVPVRVADIPREGQSAPPASRPVRPCVSGPSEVGRYPRDNTNPWCVYPSSVSLPEVRDLEESNP